MAETPSEPNPEPAQTVAIKCDGCGRPNPDGLLICPDCRTSLIQIPVDYSRKSKVLAVVLALIFGPLGLIYVKEFTWMVVLVLLHIPFIFFDELNFLSVILVRIIAASRAYQIIAAQDEISQGKQDAGRLLDEAAKLEASDRAQAISTYEEVIQSYPDTRASREAKRAIEILQRMPVVK